MSNPLTSNIIEIFLLPLTRLKIVGRRRSSIIEIFFLVLTVKDSSLEPISNIIEILLVFFTLIGGEAPILDLML